MANFQLTKVFWFLFLISIPIGLRFQLYPIGQGASEYTGLFFYLADFFAIGFLVFSWSSVIRKKPDKKAAHLYLKGFLVLAAISVFLAPLPLVALLALFKLLLFVWLSIWAAKFLAKKQIFNETVVILALMAVWEAVLGASQFILQKPLGLSWLGEPPLNAFIPGSSKLTAAGGVLLRASGTLPHPNIFGAFLVIGLISLMYLFLKLNRKSHRLARVLVSVSLAAVIFGLAVSFSRSAWLAASLASILFIGFSIRPHLKMTLKLLSVLLIGFFAVALALWPVLNQRLVASSPDERAVAERVIYNGMGIYLIQKYPFGLGLANSLPQGVSTGLYESFGLTQSYQQQPIHNLYFLIAAEIGIFGILCFIIFLFLIMTGKNSPEKLMAASILLAFLITGFFDHFLWTLEAGRAMLWLAIALVLASQNFKTRRASVV